MERKVVLGIGNILNSDEGLGVQALQALDAEFRESADVEFIDGGTLGLNLLDLVEECSHLLILDAANTGRPPGTLIELAREEIPLFSGIKMSQHQLTFQEVLGLANIRDRLPGQLHFIGIQPDCLEIGLDLSDTVKERLPDMIMAATRVLHRWGVLHATTDVAHQ